MKRRIRKRREALAGMSNATSSTTVSTISPSKKAVSLENLWPKICRNLIPILSMLLLVTIVILAVVLFVNYALPIVLKTAWKYLQSFVFDEPLHRVMQRHRNLTYETFIDDYSNTLPVLFRSSMSQDTRDRILTTLLAEYNDLPVEIGHVASLTIGRLFNSIFHSCTICWFKCFLFASGGSAENGIEMKLGDYVNSSEFTKDNPVCILTEY